MDFSSQFLQVLIKDLRLLAIILSNSSSSFQNIPKLMNLLADLLQSAIFFPASGTGRSFWNLTAFLSIILAVMNILPIPALDGGHVMFLLFEVITGRKPSDKFLEYAQIAGMVILFSLLVFANGNDILRLLQKIDLFCLDLYLIKVFITLHKF